MAQERRVGVPSTNQVILGLQISGEPVQTHIGQRVLVTESALPNRDSVL